MRGKHLAWLSLVVMLLGVALARPGFSQELPIIAVEPTDVVGVPGDLLEVDVTVTGVTDLYTYAFELHYQPALRILAAVKVIEGDFLGPITGEPEFSYDINHLAGIVKVGDTLTGDDTPGITGSGTLATIRFSVLEAGEGPLTLVNTVLIDDSLDGTFDMIAHTTADGFYHGPVAELAQVRVDAGQQWFLGHPGDVATFDARVKNTLRGGTSVPLLTRVRWDLTRRDDGRVSTFWSGQSYRTTPPPDVYLYVNGINEWYFEWDTVGTAPWLDAAGDGNYIVGTSDAAFMFWFEFEDITLGTRVIGNVVLEGYTDGTYNSGIDYDAYANNFAWLGSLYTTGAPSWVTPRWVSPDETVSVLYPPAMTEAGLNSFHLGLYFYDPGHSTIGDDVVDALRLRVEFSPVDPALPPDFVLQDNDKVWLDTATWILAEEDVGFYTGIVTCYFTYNGLYNDAKHTRRVWLSVLP